MLFPLDRLRTMCLGLGLVVLACGCSGPESARMSTDPLLAAWKSDRTQVLGDPKLLTPAEAVDPAKLFPLSPRKGEFVFTLGADTGDILPYELSQDAQGRWQYTYEGYSQTMLVRGEDGSLLSPQENDLEEEVVVAWDPPIPLLPAHLKADQPVQGQCKVVIKELDDGSAVDQGTCKYKVELLGTQSISTPAGPFDAVVVRSTRVLELDMARVWVTITTAYLPGRGQVAEHISQHTRALGLFPVQETSESRLAR